jgi:hypothetical protein
VRQLNFDGEGFNRLRGWCESWPIKHLWVPVDSQHLQTREFEGASLVLQPIWNNAIDVPDAEEFQGNGRGRLSYDRIEGITGLA